MNTLRNILGVARYERIMLMRTTRFRILGLIGIGILGAYGAVGFRLLVKGAHWGFLGSDQFAYRAHDGQLPSALATVTIVVHPADPDVVYAAVIGHIFGPNPERGVYRSTNGGLTRR